MRASENKPQSLNSLVSADAHRQQPRLHVGVQNTVRLLIAVLSGRHGRSEIRFGRCDGDRARAA